MRGRYLLFTAGAAAVHMVSSVVFLLVGTGASLGALETGSELPLPARVASTAGMMLLHPVFIPVSEAFPRLAGPMGWMLLILNSSVWAAAFYVLLRLARGRRIHRARSA